jgi:hypothetical protein
MTMSTHERHPSIGTTNFDRVKNRSEFEVITERSIKKDSINIL